MYYKLKGPAMTVEFKKKNIFEKKFKYKKIQIFEFV